MNSNRLNGREPDAGPVQAQTVLLCDEDEKTASFLGENLRADGFGTLKAATGRAMLHMLEHRSCDLVVLEVALPDVCGFELCARIRAADGLTARFDPEIPILILSHRGSEHDRIRGLTRGADDYLAKPFVYEELLARVRAILRRAGGRRREGVLRVGKLSVDPATRAVRVGEREVSLSAKEFALLRKLASEPTRVFTKRELLEKVWDYRLMGNTRTLDSHASRLRRKLNGGGHGYVINVWGVGYKLVGEAPVGPAGV